MMEEVNRLKSNQKELLSHQNTLRKQLKHKDNYFKQLKKAVCESEIALKQAGKKGEMKVEIRP